MDVISRAGHVSLGTIPGMVRGGQDVGGTNTLALIAMTMHGGRSEDQRLLIDGLTVRNIAGAGQPQLHPRHGSTQEVTIDYKNSAEAITRRDDQLHSARRRQHLQGASSVLLELNFRE
jgi:hypothetical protein